MEKKESESDSMSSKSIKGKKDSGKKVKRSIQPSLICGVLIGRTKFPVNIEGEDKGGGEVEETEVQKMNRMNEVVSADASPVTSPEIISSSDSDTKLIDSEGSLSVTCPYIIVVAVKEEVKKVSKQPSTDSLKPSTSSSNIVNTLGSISKQDWASLDYMYDSDPDVQIVKVTPGPQTLSASSPTEGTKMDEVMEVSLKTLSSSESSKTKLPSVKPGHILQCLELPAELQDKDLSIVQIKPTLDEQHLLVVLSQKCPGESAFQTGSTGSNFSTETSDVSDIDIVSSGSTYWSNSKGSSDFSEHSNTDDGNKNCSTIRQSLERKKQSHNGFLLLYRFSYEADNNYAYIEEKPVAMRKIDQPENGIERVLILPQEVSEHAEDEDAVNCDEEIFVPTPSLVSVSSNRLKNPSGMLAVILASGGIRVMNSCDLTVLANIEPPTGDKFVDATYCSGICLCFLSNYPKKTKSEK